MGRYPSSDCAVTVRAVPLDRHVDVRVSGDVDADADLVLSDTVARLAALSPEHVFVDLAEVGFAGSTLANFLAELVGVLPPAMSVTVCRPRPVHQRVLEVTGVTQILAISAVPAELRTPVEGGDHGR